MKAYEGLEIALSYTSVIDSTKNRKTCLVTFRLPEELVEDLREESKNTQISLNTLANQILNKYVAWERPSGKLGLIPMPRPLVKEIFRDIPNKRIQRVARNSCKDTIKELVLIKEGNLTLDSFISVFNEWLRASWIVHRYKKNIEGHHYVIYHNLNKTFSIYLAELFISILDDLHNYRREITVRQDSLSIAFAAKP
ncbi:MAG: hypothetical protein E6K87_01290 [Thaumarchaeota archaeon]|nr:MAG: hypothetical protein E6K87_01290 [Nitrososphaerota archaeon]